MHLMFIFPGIFKILSKILFLAWAHFFILSSPFGSLWLGWGGRVLTMLNYEHKKKNYLSHRHLQSCHFGFPLSFPLSLLSLPALSCLSPRGTRRIAGALSVPSHPSGSIETYQSGYGEESHLSAGKQTHPSTLENLKML